MIAPRRHYCPKGSSPRIRPIAVAILFLCFWMGGCSGSVDIAQDARAASQQWLKAVDDGAYDQSWDAAAGIFRKAVTKEHWQARIREVRAPLGRLKLRVLQSASVKVDPENSPAGDYLMIVYRSEFENRMDVIETHTLFLESDGRWRTAGYFVRRN